MTNVSGLTQPQWCFRRHHLSVRFGDSRLARAIRRAAFAPSTRFSLPSSALDEGPLADCGSRHLIAWAEEAFDVRHAVASVRLRVDSGFLVFERLGVLPAVQSAKVGSTVIDALEAFARSESLYGLRCSARSTMPDNRPFYLKRGFEVEHVEDARGHAGLKTRMVLHFE